LKSLHNSHFIYLFIYLLSIFNKHNCRFYIQLVEILLFADVCGIRVHLVLTRKFYHYYIRFFRQQFTTVKQCKKSKLGQMNHQIKSNAFAGKLAFLQSHRPTQKKRTCKPTHLDTKLRTDTTEKNNEGITFSRIAEIPYSINPIRYYI